VTLSGAISGSGGLTKTFTGALILGSGNTYTGGTTVSAGTLDGPRQRQPQQRQCRRGQRRDADTRIHHQHGHDGGPAPERLGCGHGYQQLQRQPEDRRSLLRRRHNDPSLRHVGFTSSTATHKDTRFIGSGLLNNSIAITVTAAANSKTYDGTTSAAATPTITGSLASGDTATLTETYDTKNTGTGKTLTPTAVIKDSGNNVVTANYTITYVNNAAGAINAAPLAYVANTASRNYGSANPAFSGTVSGFVGTGHPGQCDDRYAGLHELGDSVKQRGQLRDQRSGLAANNGNYTLRRRQAMPRH